MTSARARTDLTRYAWLSIAAAAVTIALKTIAWRLTGSVGLLSDAAESLVNLAAAVLALAMLSIAARPPDDDHHFGHAKAEYFSAAVEGILIFIAAFLIITSAIERFLNAQPLDRLGSGALLAAAASLVNGAVGAVLIRAGRRHRSVTLSADGKHLMTDVITSVGVIAGIGLVWLTGWQWLDPVVAIAVGANIIVMGTRLVRESVGGLMDETLAPEDNRVIAEVLAAQTTESVGFHGLRTRQAGRLRFATFDMLVPGRWSVRRGHDLVEEVEAAIRQALPDLRVTVHLEPREDPRSYGDYEVEVPIAESPSSPPRPGE
ncbi:MAG: cation diffusion facilitator family transporter [Propionibacteriaceae bacterium]|jgi:cation diffusion facilitator family transporter|nr:cation diffusion facilitator family transporter [Propionibacteriaceae bacterium]